MRQPETKSSSSLSWRSRIAVALACIGLGGGVGYEIGQHSQDDTVQNLRSDLAQRNRELLKSKSEAKKNADRVTFLQRDFEEVRANRDRLNDWQNFVRSLPAEEGQSQNQCSYEERIRMERGALKMIELLGITNQTDINRLLEAFRKGYTKIDGMGDKYISLTDPNAESDDIKHAYISLTEPITVPDEYLPKSEKIPLTGQELKIKQAIDEGGDLNPLLREYDLDQLKLPDGVKDPEHEKLLGLMTGLQKDLSLTDDEAIKKDLFCRSMAKFIRNMEENQTESASEANEPSEAVIVKQRQLNAYMEALATTLGIEDPENCVMIFDQLPPCYSLGNRK